LRREGLGKRGGFLSRASKKKGPSKEGHSGSAKSIGVWQKTSPFEERKKEKGKMKRGAYRRGRCGAIRGKKVGSFFGGGG